MRKWWRGVRRRWREGIRPEERDLWLREIEQAMQREGNGNQVSSRFAAVTIVIAVGYLVFGLIRVWNGW